MGVSEQKHRLTSGNMMGGIVSIPKKVRTTAKAVRSTGRFCVNPMCLHVAGSVKCSRSCCKISKRRKG